MEGTEAGRDAQPSERQRWDPRRSVGRGRPWGVSDLVIQEAGLTG